MMKDIKKGTKKKGKLIMTNDDIITYGWECEGENTQGDITDCWVNGRKVIELNHNS